MSNDPLVSTQEIEKIIMAIANGHAPDSFTEEYVGKVVEWVEQVRVDLGIIDMVLAGKIVIGKPDSDGEFTYALRKRLPSGPEGGPMSRVSDAEVERLAEYLHKQHGWSWARGDLYKDARKMLTHALAAEDADLPTLSSLWGAAPDAKLNRPEDAEPQPEPRPQCIRIPWVDYDRLQELSDGIESWFKENVPGVRVMFLRAAPPDAEGTTVTTTPDEAQAHLDGLKVEALLESTLWSQTHEEVKGSWRRRRKDD